MVFDKETRQMGARSQKLEDKLEKALEYLEEQLSKGSEYPDAHTAACLKFRLSVNEGDLLGYLYDQRGE